MRASANGMVRSMVSPDSAASMIWRVIVCQPTFVCRSLGIFKRCARTSRKVRSLRAPPTSIGVASLRDQSGLAMGEQLSDGFDDRRGFVHRLWPIVLEHGI